MLKPLAEAQLGDSVDPATLPKCILSDPAGGWTNCKRVAPVGTPDELWKVVNVVEVGR